MRLASHAGLVEHQRISERIGVFGDIEAVRLKPFEGIQGGRAFARDAERIEDIDRSEPFAGATGDPGILALRVDADDGAIGGEQIGDDGTDTLAGSGRGNGHQMRGAVISQ